MPTKEELKRRACQVIDRRKDELIGIAPRYSGAS